MLNAALASGDIARVNRVAQANGQAVASAYLTDGAEYALLDKAGYFAQLQAAGFTGAHTDCMKDGGPLPQRLL
ncbi:hypothetical protein FGX01_01820, partial [Xylella fastidiosa subsp. multiplex]|nr:hypothetical protein [Xylella fastidiosa subsp. multiplex]